jgi:hypothetical protein
VEMRSLGQQQQRAGQQAGDGGLLAAQRCASSVHGTGNM